MVCKQANHRKLTVKNIKHDKIKFWLHCTKFTKSNVDVLND